MVEIPLSLRSEGELCALLGSLTLSERSLLNGVCRFIYNPFHLAPPPLLAPYSLAFSAVYGALEDGWGDEEYSRLVDVVVDAVPGDGWGEYGWGLVQRLCMSLAAEHPSGVLRDLLVPLRLVASVDREWHHAVVEALPNLGLERALALPALALPALAVPA